MKKTLSLAFFAAVCAAGSAFAGKMKADADPQWLLNDDTIVTGTTTQIKLLYCPGPNNVICAVSLDGKSTIVRKT
jgi:hypothetical protein